MKYKALAADIDATLTDQYRVLQPESLQAIALLEVPLVLATGNTHCFSRAAAIMTGARQFIAENGGIISLDDEMELLADRAPCDLAYSRLKERFHVEMFDSRYRLTDLVLKIGFDIHKAQEYLNKEGMPVELVETGFAVHIKNQGVSKGTGLREIARRLGIGPEEFVAVGDSASDLPMFAAAGFSAAVANATPELRAAADYVAPEPYGKGFLEIVRYMKAQNIF